MYVWMYKSSCVNEYLPQPVHMCGLHAHLHVHSYALSHTHPHTHPHPRMHTCTPTCTPRTIQAQMGQECSGTQRCARALSLSLSVVRTTHALALCGLDTGVGWTLTSALYCWTRCVSLRRYARTLASICSSRSARTPPVLCACACADVCWGRGCGHVCGYRSKHRDGAWVTTE